MEEPTASAFQPEEGGSSYLRNVSKSIQKYTPSHPRK